MVAQDAPEHPMPVLACEWTFAPISAAGNQRSECAGNGIGFGRYFANHSDRINIVSCGSIQRSHASVLSGIGTVSEFGDSHTFHEYDSLRPLESDVQLTTSIQRSVGQRCFAVEIALALETPFQQSLLRDLSVERVTKMLAQIEAGNHSAAEELLPLVYDELRSLARARLKSESGQQTLQATALVHEAYLRLVGGEADRNWDSRGHFFASAAEAMRRLLIDRARRKKTEKHGRDFQRVSIEFGDLSAPTRDDDLLALDAAIERLEAIDCLKAELVKLRYFAGLTNEQAAAALGIGVSTAEKHWAYSRSWLRSEISRLREP